MRAATSCKEYKHTLLLAAPATDKQSAGHVRVRKTRMTKTPSSRVARVEAPWDLLPHDFFVHMPTPQPTKKLKTVRPSMAQIISCALEGRRRGGGHITARCSPSPSERTHPKQ